MGNPTLSSRTGLDQSLSKQSIASEAVEIACADLLIIEQINAWQAQQCAAICSDDSLARAVRYGLCEYGGRAAKGCRLNADCIELP
jgi:hypothetical protein